MPSFLWNLDEIPTVAAAAYNLYHKMMKLKKLKTQRSFAVRNPPTEKS